MSAITLLKHQIALHEFIDEPEQEQAQNQFEKITHTFSPILFVLLKNRFTENWSYPRGPIITIGGNLSQKEIQAGPHYINPAEPVRQ